MKLLHIIFAIMLPIMSYATDKTVVQLEPYSEHSGNVWTVRRFPVSRITKPHAKVQTNNVMVKWNIAKGRVRIHCDGLCDTTERYMVRLYDKDSLRIDFIAYDLEVNKVYADSEYIVPKSYRHEISYMELKLLDNDVEEEFADFRGEFLCFDGYSLTDSVEPQITITGRKTTDNYKIGKYSMTDMLVYLWIEHSFSDNWYNNSFYSSCVESSDDTTEPMEYSYPSDENESCENTELTETEEHPPVAYTNTSSSSMEFDDAHCWGDPNGSWFCN